MIVCSNKIWKNYKKYAILVTENEIGKSYWYGQNQSKKRVTEQSNCKFKYDVCSLLYSSVLTYQWQWQGRHLSLLFEVSLKNSNHKVRTVKGTVL